MLARAPSPEILEPTSCGAGRAILEFVRENREQENARKIGGPLLQRNHELKKKHVAIGDVRGCGLMLDIENVKDRKTKNRIGN